MGVSEITDLDQKVTVSDDSLQIPVVVNVSDDGLVRNNGAITGFHIPEDEAWRLVPEFARDRDFPFFRSTVEFVIESVKQYAGVKRDLTEGEEEEVWKKISETLHESELLQRILSGQKPTVVVPPKSFKSHWYELVENGEAIPEKVRWAKWTSTTGTGGAINKKDDDEYVYIDEKHWKIEETIVEHKEDPVVVVSYNHLAPRYMLRKANDEEKDRLLHRRQRNIGKDLNEFILIRLEEQDESGDDTGS